MDRRTEDTKGVGSEKIGWEKGHHTSPEANGEGVREGRRRLSLHQKNNWGRLESRLVHEVHLVRSTGDG